MNILVYDLREYEKNYFEAYPNDDFDIKLIKSPLNEDTEVDDFDSQETSVVSIFTTSRINSNVLDKFRNLRVVATRSTGFDHIDIDECAKRNISVLNVEEYGKTSVAEYTIGMIIMLVRKIVPSIIDLRRQDVDYARYAGRDIGRMKLGVVGTGAIGSYVCKIAKSLGMEIFAYDVLKNPAIEEFVSYVSLETLLENSDIITLHIPYNKENYHIISSREISLMKNGSYIINTARGELLDTMALYESIVSGKLAGCALDVQECEYLAIDTDFDLVKRVEKADKECIQRAMVLHKLAEQDNVIITPHIAYNTLDAVDTILKTTFSSIRDCLKGMSTNKIV